MPERQVDLGELDPIFNHIGTKDLFLSPYLCVCHSFLDKGEQVIGEECCTGFNESQTLGLIDVCHNLSQREMETEVKFIKTQSCDSEVETSGSHLKLLHRQFGCDPGQKLVLAHFSLKQLLIGQDKIHSAVSRNVDGDRKLLHLPSGGPARTEMMKLPPLLHHLQHFSSQRT